MGASVCASPLALNCTDVKPGEQQSRPDPLRRARQADPPEPRQLPVAEPGREVVEGRVDAAEGGARDEDEER